MSFFIENGKRKILFKFSLHVLTILSHAMALKKIDKIIRTFSSHFECTPLYLHPQYSSVPLSEMRSKCIENEIYKKEDLTYTEC